jgi:hypothetical protein
LGLAYLKKVATVGVYVSGDSMIAKIPNDKVRVGAVVSADVKAFRAVGSALRNAHPDKMIRGVGDLRMFFVHYRLF